MSQASPDPAAMQNLLDMLQELQDKTALQELVYSYCRASDRRDYALMRDLYAEDGYDDHGVFFSGPARDYIAWLPSILDTWECTMHCVMNCMFKVDGDRAEGEIYKMAYHRAKPPDPFEYLSGGRYFDRYVRQDGVWRFAHRKLVQDFQTRIPAGAGTHVPYPEGTAVGLPGAQDSLYSFLTLFRRGQR